MIASLLAALPIALAAGLAGVAWSRRAPRRALRRIVALNAAVAVGAIAETLVEVFDAVVRVGANLISFTRLAAFGLMHAALGAVLLDGARGMWSAGTIGRVAAVVVFTVGHAGAFALEALVAGVQAMRLEYYELFSRLFAGEGEPFSPWRIPVVRKARPI